MSEFDLESMQSAVTARLEAVAKVSEELAQIRVSGRDSDEIVTVTLGAGSALLGVEFKDREVRHRSEDIEKAILEAHRDAGRRLGEQMAKITAHLPDASSIQDMISGRIPENLRDAMDNERAEWADLASGSAGDRS